VSVHGPPLLYFEPLQLLKFECYAAPNSAFHSNADPDPNHDSKNNAVRDPKPCLPVFRIHDIFLYGYGSGSADPYF
jgi:hypothetical protein